MTGLRVLGVRADPPEIRPLQSTPIEILAHHTENEELGYLWIACDPVFDVEPGSQPNSACQDEASLSSSSGLEGLFSTGAARPLSFDLTATSATYLPPTDEQGTPLDLFADLPADDPRREVGASITLVIVVAPLEDLTAMLADPEGASLERERTEIVLKRIIVSESDTPNTSPAILSLLVGPAAYLPGEAIPFDAAPLIFEPQLSAPEDFEWHLPDGSVSQETEQPIVSWYSTAGRFGSSRSLQEEENTWTPPRTGDVPGPSPTGEYPLWVVVRDGRGGQAWAEFLLR
ncbi:MAG: hypothetical protein P1V51_15590 [Deltaproteobacteria bacterium]|nr:hypothetical protein [Deltaproteobacteria bacterium]